MYTYKIHQHALYTILIEQNEYIAAKRMCLYSFRHSLLLDVLENTDQKKTPHLGVKRWQTWTLHNVLETVLRCQKEYEHQRARKWIWGGVKGLFECLGRWGSHLRKGLSHCNMLPGAGSGIHPLFSGTFSAHLDKKLGCLGSPVRATQHRILCFMPQAPSNTWAHAWAVLQHGYTNYKKKINHKSIIWC